MSQRPIALSPDLLKLRSEGYDLFISGGHLLVRDVPYVTASATVARGTLVSRLELTNDVTNKPSDHVAMWMGEHPCDHQGRKLTAIENPSGPMNLGEGLVTDHYFSAKADYRDYHHKITAYIAAIAGQAKLLDSSATARTFPVITDGEEGVFKYLDTASSRAGIEGLNDRYKNLRIGVVGLGGTGAYVLDLVAKTHVAEIHLYDGDVFDQHNAFRAPGAPSGAMLAKRRKKVRHFARIYSAMRTGVVAHPCYLTRRNVRMLDNLDFVFICVDQAAAKKLVVERLTSKGIPFIEVGMGLLLDDHGRVGGLVRTATSTSDTRAEALAHISFANAAGADEYATNIQIADLNCLNAALAVARWKRMIGVYRDSRGEFYSGYSVASGELVVEGIK